MEKNGIRLRCLTVKDQPTPVSDKAVLTQFFFFITENRKRRGQRVEPDGEQIRYVRNNFIVGIVQML